MFHANNHLDGEISGNRADSVSCRYLLARFSIDSFHSPIDP